MPPGRPTVPPGNPSALVSAHNFGQSRGHSLHSWPALAPLLSKFLDEPFLRVLRPVVERVTIQHTADYDKHDPPLQNRLARRSSGHEGWQGAGGESAAVHSDERCLTLRTIDNEHAHIYETGSPIAYALIGRSAFVKNECSDCNLARYEQRQPFRRLCTTRTMLRGRD